MKSRKSSQEVQKKNCREKFESQIDFYSRSHVGWEMIVEFERWSRGFVCRMQ